MLLQFAEQLAELLRETRPAGAAPEQFQFVLVPHQQRAQHHDAAFIVQLVGGRDRQLFQDKSRQPVERKNMQPRVAGQCPCRRATGVRAGTWPVWARAESAAGLRHCRRNAARISARQRNVLPLPAGPRRKRACTPDFSRKAAAAQSNLLESGCIFCIIFFISFRADLVMLAACWKNPNSIQRRTTAKSYATDTH